MTEKEYEIKDEAIIEVSGGSGTQNYYDNLLKCINFNADQITFAFRANRRENGKVTYYRRIYNINTGELISSDTIYEPDLGLFTAVAALSCEAFMIDNCASYGLPNIPTGKNL